MCTLIETGSFNEFYDYNKKLIYGNRLSFYHLIKMIQQVNETKIGPYTAYNIINDEGANVLAVWTDGIYYLYGTTWTEEILDKLTEKIDLPKFRNFTFSGTRELVLDFFAKTDRPYTIYKDRLLYECTQLLPIKGVIPGVAIKSSTDDLEELAEMVYHFGLEEWGEREGRDMNHARQLVWGGILSGNICDWEVAEEITTIGQIIDMETRLPIIGSLYTKPDKRKKGYAYAFVHEIVSQLLKGGYKKCGIISDATNDTTNKIFKEIGFVEVAKYISVNITPIHQ